MAGIAKSVGITLGLTLFWIAPMSGQIVQPASTAGPPSGKTSAADNPAAPLAGTISGTVMDPTGAVISGARIRITPQDQSLSRETLSGGGGDFSFGGMPAGPFQLTISSTGFATQTFSGVVSSGEINVVPPIEMTIAANINSVEVELTRTEVAEQEIKVEEKQRVLGVVPNFYVSYVADAVPLTSKQKFKLAWKNSVDPITFGIVGIVAGYEQAENHFAGYGQGAEGYGKRFGAGYADTVIGTYIGAAILPSLLKQDPRYFYRGTGSKPSRFFYAIANSVICKGDNGHWQTNYSNILGSLAAGGISNLYYPEQDRSGASLTIENGAIGLGATAAANVFQEFVVKKLTPKVPRNDPSKP